MLMSRYGWDSRAPAERNVIAGAAPNTNPTSKIQTCKLKITSTTITRVTVPPTRKKWHTRHPVLISVTVHDQHRKKAYRETPAETA